MGHLATAGHIVKPASNVLVPTSTAIEFIPLRVFGPLVPTVNIIVSIPAIEDILALVSEDVVGAVAPVEHVFVPVMADPIHAGS